MNWDCSIGLTCCYNLCPSSSSQKEKKKGGKEEKRKACPREKGKKRKVMPSHPELCYPPTVILQQAGIGLEEGGRRNVKGRGEREREEGGTLLSTIVEL